VTLEINVTVHGEVVARLDAVPAKLRAALDAKFRSEFEEIYHQAIGVFSGGKYSTSSEVEHGVDSIGSTLIGFMEPITTKAQVQEFGGQSYYEIFPTKARVLRFIGRSGEVVFRPRVFHPPVRGKHYIAETIAAALPHLRTVLVEALEEVRL
jgi:antitoxin (DNA-binding transcriptional repressor) of toxin-antitoxin stability system